MYQTRAILIRRYRLSETSLIIVWLTDHHGKVKTVARGATKQGGVFSGRLELFSEAEIGFALSKKNDLHSLKEVVPSPSWQAMSSNYLTLLGASYFAELCDLFTEPVQPVPEIFGLLRRALVFLSQQAPTVRVIQYFEIELAKALGIYDPSLPGEYSLKTLVHRLPETRRGLLEHLREKNDLRR
ncbi:MAG: DNA repair protein RecO [Verrucomicrobia bacterium RIFCSPHIGHO2_12_FULL_41_10]|nr:MAG: DNA repair protein RecO [Verrucomicrobia bacterium RIFCSPHIGHO2_12_FULL_41_10]HLB32762.1 DNA repair protein RecO [Chthoniobacterales bacterium]